MSLTAVAFLVASSLYAGFQWTIRVVVYPQFARVGAVDFPDYERAHQRLVSVAVGPLFAALVASAVAVTLHPPAASSRLLPGVGLASVASILGLTALAAVPLHGRLEHGFDPSLHRRLLGVDALRLVAALAATATAVAITVR